MRPVALGRFGKARLFVDEEVGASYKTVRVEERSYVSAGHVGGHTRRIALEVYLPRGPRVDYGLLGIRYDPRDGQGLIVQVHVGEYGDRRYDESLAVAIDEVRVGLPHEYAATVVDGVGSVAPGLLAPGLLVVDRAAYGPVGSSPHLFAQLAAALVRLVASQDPPDAQIVEMFGPQTP